MLHTKTPREQAGRDSFDRYRAQVRSAAIAALSILEGHEVDRVYCDLHDDFVVRKNAPSGITYVFYQVKTKGKQNKNWTLNEVFGLKASLNDQAKQDSHKIRDSFAGKLLLHTVVFGKSCEGAVFQTNVHNDDRVDDLCEDITNGEFKNKFTLVLIDRFNECFSIGGDRDLSENEIKRNLARLKFENDVQYLKSGHNNFEPLVRDKIYQFSEVDLEYVESREIIVKLLELVARKSSGAISELTAESVDELAGISVEDLLSILSLSKDAYEVLLKGGDDKAIKSVSIIQRTLAAAGARSEDVEYCSRCKTAWDLWLRKNRHTIPEFDLKVIMERINGIISSESGYRSSILLSNLRAPIKDLKNDLESEGLLYGLSIDLLLGGVFAELVKVKA